MGIARGRPPALCDIDLFRLPKSDAPTMCRWLGEGEWLMIHWIPGRGGMPHLDGDCSWCSVPPNKDPPALKLYSPVERFIEDRRVWKRSVLELPGEAASRIIGLDRGLIRGVIRKNKEYVFCALKEPSKIDNPAHRMALELPMGAAFDVIDVLLRYWGLTRQDLEAGPAEQPDIVKFQQKRQA